MMTSVPISVAACWKSVGSRCWYGALIAPNDTMLTKVVTNNNMKPIAGCPIKRDKGVSAFGSLELDRILVHNDMPVL